MMDPYQRRFWRRLLRWFIAALAGASAAAFRYALIPIMGIEGRYLVLMPVVMAVTVSMGYFAGLIASAVGVYFIQTWLYEPIGTFKLDVPSLMRLILIFIGTSYVGYVGWRLRLARNRAHAEALAARRSEELLRNMAEDLARSNHDLEQFASIASHDLKGPMRTISGYLNLLQRKHRGSLDREGNEFIGFASEAANSMLDLINGLLAYSRAGTQGWQPRETDMERVLEKVRASQQAAIQESGAVLTHDVLPKVWADEAQMVQLLTNLVSNALKFRGEEAPRIHVGAEGKGGEWVFSVRDNGIGIDPKFHDRIFVIFKRLHDQEKYPGSGLGLAICKKIVERHGGLMWVESQVGQGTTFFFTLPAKIPPPEEEGYSSAMKG